VQAQQQDALRALGAQAVEAVDVLARKVSGLISQPLQVDGAVLGLDLLQEGFDPGREMGTAGQPLKPLNSADGTVKWKLVGEVKE
jgi:hypothetical protein